MRDPSIHASPTSGNVVLATSLDAGSNARLTALAAQLQCTRPRLLRALLPWGVAHAQDWPLSRERPPSPAQNISVRVTRTLHREVQDAARAAGVPVSDWLRHVIRHVTPEALQAGGPLHSATDAWDDRAWKTLRSHDSRTYAKRMMIRFDEETGRRLVLLMQVFERPAAEIIRHLLMQATPEDFPPQWSLTAEARQTPGARREDHTAGALPQGKGTI